MTTQTLSLNAALDSHKEPRDFNLQKAVPVIEHQMSNMNHQIASRFEAQHQSVVNGGREAHKDTRSFNRCRQIIGAIPSYARRNGSENNILQVVRMLGQKWLNARLSISDLVKKDVIATFFQ